MPDLPRDYQGRELPDKYAPDADGMVTVWEVEPSGAHGIDSVYIRGWQDMLSHLTDALDGHLEDLEIGSEPGDKSEHKYASFRLVCMTPYQWKEFCRLGREYPGEPIDWMDIPKEETVDG